MVGECQGGNDHQNLRQALSGFQLLEYSERPHVELDDLFFGWASSVLSLCFWKANVIVMALYKVDVINTDTYIFVCLWKLCILMLLLIFK